MNILPKEGYHLESDRLATHLKANWRIFKRRVKRLTIRDWISGFGRMFLYMVSLSWSAMLVISSIIMFPPLIEYLEDYIVNWNMSGPAITLIRMIPLWCIVTSIILAVLIPQWVYAIFKAKKKE